MMYVAFWQLILAIGHFSIFYYKFFIFFLPAAYVLTTCGCCQLPTALHFDPIMLFMLFIYLCCNSLIDDYFSYLPYLLYLLVNHPDRKLQDNENPERVSDPEAEPVQLPVAVI